MYLNLQVVFVWWYRAGITVCVCAIRVVTLIKIEQHFAVPDVGHGQIYVPATAVSGVIIGHVVKRNEQFIFVGRVVYQINALVYVKCQRYVIEHEGQYSVFPERFLLAAVRGNFERRAAARFGEGSPNTVFMIGRKEGDVFNLRALYRASLISKQIFNVMLSK